jgi:hypothetical protein
MATAKQKAAAKRNIKKAQAARWGYVPRTAKALKHKGRIKTPINKVGTPLDKVTTLI